MAVDTIAGREKNNTKAERDHRALLGEARAPSEWRVTPPTGVPERQNFELLVPFHDTVIEVVPDAREAQATHAWQ